MPAVYIITNHARSVLYTGVTNDLERRIQEHRRGEGDGFAAKYKCKYLVYYATANSMPDAIQEEKRIKSGSRQAKVRLIEEMNPDWSDLSKDWNI